eukprot:13939713-Alexandrium_andersonii.AAC.1
MLRPTCRSGGVATHPSRTRWFRWACACACCGAVNGATPLRTMMPARAGGSAPPTAFQSACVLPERFMVSGMPCSLAISLGRQ